MRLNFVSNYNATLLHFVSKFTLWSIYVSPTYKDYLEENYQLAPEATQVLENMNQKMAQLGWDYETILHQWATEGFPNPDQYREIYDAVRYFEDLPDKQGKTLRSIIEEVQPNIDAIRQNLGKRFEEFNLTEDFEKIQKLIEFHTDLEVLPAFVVYSPEPWSLQGGANGEGIVVEVNPENKESNSEFYLVVHEYGHKALNPSHYFEYLVEGDEREFFKQSNSKISGNKFFDHMEELIIRSVIDVRIFHVDIKEKIANYKSREGKRPALHADSWAHVEYIFPIINQYLDAKIDIREARIQLTRAFKQIVKDYA